jgi:hypothetical protein
MVRLIRLLLSSPRQGLEKASIMPHRNMKWCHHAGTDVQQLRWITKTYEEPRALAVASLK